MGNLLSVGQSGLLAAQVAINTTGHNIANASTPGYSRQIAVQTSAGGQNTGNGFIGQGSSVSSVERIYDQYTATRVNASTTNKAGYDAYLGQVTQINNLFSDPTSGLSPALQDFFGNVQGLAASPNAAAQRQTLLSSGQSLASRFNSLDSQLSQLSEGVNKQVISSVDNINNYAKQIATLNDAIEKTRSNGDGSPPNDLLDQRDLLVSQLSKEVKVTVSDQIGSGYNISIGKGQPLVIGPTTYSLKAVTSTTDSTRLDIAYQSGGKLSRLSDTAISGGTLGGLLDFRANSLDPARNELGRVAVGIATSFNDQSKLGIDQNGKPGKDFFKIPGPVVTASSSNAGNDVVGASITDISGLTGKDYRVAYVGGASSDYSITRIGESQPFYTGVFPPATAQDGLTFTKTLGSLSPAVGDFFLIRPTINAASGIAAALTDKTEIAAAAPVITTTISTNGGNGKISPGTVDASYLATPLTAPITLKYSAGSIDSVPTGTTGFPVTYASGSNITFGGITFNITGAPIDGDTFTIGLNTNGAGDSRNAVLLGSLQTANKLDKGSTTFTGAFSQLVNSVGNKTREQSTNVAAEGRVLASATELQQSQSGVNLDEEATNLLRYQQAYQAAGKMMQTASTLFDVLLSLGR